MTLYNALKSALSNSVASGIRLLFGVAKIVIEGEKK
jgi:hypothetical protein